MNQYAKYKNTNIYWFCDIIVHWKLKKFKLPNAPIELVKEKTDDEGVLIAFGGESI
jgi:hypothetical protein